MDNGTATGWEQLLSRTLPPEPSPHVSFIRSQRDGLSAMVDLAKPPAVEPLGPDLAAQVVADPERDSEQQAEGDARFAHLPGVCLFVVILTVQAALTARLLRVNSAFTDEALYLWAGHLEWAHWLHGVRIPPFATYFSGAPVLYPPIAAIADNIGGLVAARALSLCFMLGTTSLLWATASRLFGRPAAYFSAALFAMLGPTLHIGAFATYDAMALFFLALAGWCACGAAEREDATGWILAAAGALVVANATKYATALFDPVVIALAVLCACPRPGGKIALRRGTLLTTCLTGGLALLVRIGGSWYVDGVKQTTTMRASGGSPALVVLIDSWTWTGVVAACALAGVATAMLGRQHRLRVLLVIVLAAAALLVPAEQARIHTTVSLDKHVDFGAWFAAIAAGYLIARLVSRPRRQWLRQLVSVPIALGVALVASAGIDQSVKMINWPNSGRLIAYLRTHTAADGRFLAEDVSIPEYYLRDDTTWQQWSGTFSITMPSGHVQNEDGRVAPYLWAIRHHYFRVVILSFNDTASLDRQIADALVADPAYHVAAIIPYGIGGNYTIWQLQASRRKPAKAFR